MNSTSILNLFKEVLQQWFSRFSLDIQETVAGGFLGAEKKKMNYFCLFVLSLVLYLVLMNHKDFSVGWRQILVPKCLNGFESFWKKILSVYLLSWEREKEKKNRALMMKTFVHAHFPHCMCSAEPSPIQISSFVCVPAERRLLWVMGEYCISTT